MVPKTYSVQRIFNSGNILTDADVKNLVILIPEKNLINSLFLPTDATIVAGTKVIWVNGEKDMVHGIEIHNETGNTIYLNSTIKFTNTTSFTFDKKGVYTYFDPNSPTDSGTIEVIAKEKSIDNSSTNSTTPSVGLFVVPKADKQFWDVRLNGSGLNIIDIYGFTNINLPTLDDEAKERVLYLYTQKLKEEHPLIVMVIDQINALEQQLSHKQPSSFAPY